MVFLYFLVQYLGGEFEWRGPRFFGTFFVIGVIGRLVVVRGGHHNNERPCDVVVFAVGALFGQVGGAVLFVCNVATIPGQRVGGYRGHRVVTWNGTEGCNMFPTRYFAGYTMGDFVGFVFLGLGLALYHPCVAGRRVAPLSAVLSCGFRGGLVVYWLGRVL